MPKRSLSTFELAEARLVFADGLDYTRVGVWDEMPLPNWIADVGAALRSQRRTANNAVTLGNTSYFPVALHADTDAGEMAWLIHELTHQWQFQRVGWRYLWEAVNVQVRAGPKGYDYTNNQSSKEAALTEAKVSGKRLADFNREQQGDIARDYYSALKQGRDPRPWEPFVSEFRSKKSEVR
jgi:type VI secretion system secreted protein VgrG